MSQAPIAWDPYLGQDAAASDERVRVAAPAGGITGLRRDGVSVFRGVRYAEPPTGERRFAAPVDAAPVAEIDATAWGDVSLQDLDPLPRRIPGAEGYYYAPGIRFSEDCLRLNVWTSAPVDGDAVHGDAAGAPVLVWFHGGGFVWGSGTGPWVDGTRFAREHGMVVVTVTYRLGLPGNLWLGDVDPTVSDLGIQDQTAALRWVQRNIAAFGGDPGRVTIMGQSAGALSVGGHLVAPASRGLFHGAVMISGHLGLTPSVDEAVAVRDRVLAELGVDRDGDVLAALRRLSTTRLQQIQREVGLARGSFPLVRDGVVIPADPMGAVAAGEAAAVPLLIGYDTEENRLWEITDSIPPVPTPELLAGLLDDDAELVAQALALYADLAAEEPDRSYLVANDQSWAAPVHTLAETHAAAGNDAFVYEFTRRSPVVAGVFGTRVGAAHLSELPFFWGNLDAPGVTGFLGDEVRTDAGLRDLADRVSGTIARFAATGSPDGGPLGSWPATSAHERVTMVIGEEVSGAEHDRHADRISFWRQNAATPAGPAIVEIAE